MEMLGLYWRCTVRSVVITYIVMAWVHFTTDYAARTQPVGEYTGEQIAGFLAVGLPVGVSIGLIWATMLVILFHRRREMPPDGFENKDRVATLQA